MNKFKIKIKLPQSDLKLFTQLTWTPVLVRIGRRVRSDVLVGFKHGPALELIGLIDQPGLI